LGRIGAETAEAVPALTKILQDSSVTARWAGADSLWSIGPAAVAATPELVAALNDTSWVVRWSSARALGAIVGGAYIETTVAALAAALRDKDSRVCEAAAFALEQIGSPAQSALTALSEAATGGTGEVGADDPSRLHCQVIDVGAAVEKVLMNNGWTVRWASVRALGVVAAGRQEALSPLSVALLDEEWQVRGIAALAIGQFGENASATAVTAVTHLIQDENAAVRKAAVIALGEIGPPARPAIAELRAASNDDNAVVREAATKAIEKILVKNEGQLN
jgi:HEAT repeat protein